MTQVRDGIGGAGAGGGILADMVDSNELVMLNNKDFFADDIYDYKETFMRHGSNSGKTHVYFPFNSFPFKRITRIYEPNSLKRDIHPEHTNLQ